MPVCEQAWGQRPCFGSLLVMGQSLGSLLTAQIPHSHFPVFPKQQLWEGGVEGAEGKWLFC